MNLSYQRANPRSGNESFLLRFDEGVGQTACVLVDAGDGVDVDSLLSDGEYLTAIVLTHAHGDHYQSLAENLRDGAPIFTSRGTAQLFETVLSDAARHSSGNSDIEGVVDAVEVLDGWTSPVEGLRLAPVPAGHAPGAAGFVFQFEEGDGPETVLATGDWTSERAAGYPGFDESLPLDVGAVFLTGATHDSYADTFTESVTRICERAYAGSPVLASATGLTGLKYAYVLGHLAERFNHPLQVRVAGQTAKLYADLGYDVPNVEAVPEFDDPNSLLVPETVTIAGPEAPTRGSSGALFDTVRADPTATLVQLRSSGSDPVSPSGSACAIFDFEVVAHPSDDEVDAMVGALDPAQVVVTHQHRGAANRFTERYSSFTWTNGDSKEYTLYEDGRWKAPPWMSSEGVAHVRRSGGSERSRRLGDVIDDGGVLLPVYRRTDAVDLAAEGLDIDALEEQFVNQISETGNCDSRSDLDILPSEGLHLFFT